MDVSRTGPKFLGNHVVTAERVGNIRYLKANIFKMLQSTKKQKIIKFMN